MLLHFVDQGNYLGDKVKAYIPIHVCYANDQLSYQDESETDRDKSKAPASF